MDHRARWHRGREGRSFAAHEDVDMGADAGPGVEEPADLEDVLDQRDGDGSDEVTAARDALDVAFFDEPRESFANGRSAGTQLAGKLRFTQGRAGRANPVHDAVLDLDVDLLASARLDTLRVRAVYGSCQARRWTKSFNK